MFEIFRKKRIERYTQGAEGFVRYTYQPPSPPLREKAPEEKSLSAPDDRIRRSVKNSGRYSVDDSESSPEQGDRYRQDVVKRLFSQYPLNSRNLIKLLDFNLDLTFVDVLTWHIHGKGWRDSKVYKAAQLDRRLFSKIMSNREYKPSKDTALALAIALELTVQQTNDLLSRAGYTLSHSNKRDVIIEYFIREGVYNLADINEVLYKLDQKIIGR